MCNHCCPLMKAWQPISHHTCTKHPLTLLWGAVGKSLQWMKFEEMHFPVWTSNSFTAAPRSNVPTKANCHRCLSDPVELRHSSKWITLTDSFFSSNPKKRLFPVEDFFMWSVMQTSSRLILCHPVFRATVSLLRKHILKVSFTATITSKSSLFNSLKKWFPPPACYVVSVTARRAPLSSFLFIYCQLFIYFSQIASD